MRHCVAAVLVAGTLVTPLFADEDDQALDPVTLQLKWRHSFQFAGYYAAKWKGLYREEGLDVTFREGAPNDTPIQSVVENRTQYGVMAGGLLYARLKGEPVVALAAIFQHSPFVILVRKDSGISSPADLVGRRIMKASTPTFMELYALLLREGIPLDSITLVDKPTGISGLIEKKVDAMSAYVTSEPHLMRMAGVEPRVIRPIDYGVDFYGDCLFTSERELRRRPGRVAAFRRASLRGWEYAMTHVEELAELIAVMPGVEERGITLEHLRYEAEQMEPLIHAQLVEIGHMNPGRWKRMADTYVDIGMVNPGTSLDRFIYDPQRRAVRYLLHTLLGGLGGIVAVGLLAWIWTRQLRRAVKRSTEQLRHSEEALRHAARNSDRLRALLVNLNRCNTLDDMLPYLLKAAIEASGMEGGAIYLIEDGMAVIHHDRGLPAAFIEAERRKPASWSVIKQVMQNSGSSDLCAISDEVRDLMQPYGLRHAYTVPLRVGKDVFGFLNAATTQERPPDSVRIHFLAVLALEAESAFNRLKAEEEHRRLIPAIEQAAEHIVITDVKGTIQYVNPAFERVTGYAREEVIGKNPRMLKSGRHDNAFYRDMWDHLAHGKTWMGRIVNKRKDESLFTEEATISPVRDASGNIVGYVGVKRDMTHEIALEEQLRQSQKMEAVGQLAGGMAHDFNNLLQVIIGYTSLILSDLDGPTPYRSDIEQVHAAAQRASKLTGQLLTFSRRQVMEPMHLDLNDVVENLMKMLRGLLGAHIDLQIVSGRKLWMINADRGQLDQVLVNICVNARDAMPKGGRLTIETRNASLDDAYCSTHPWARPGRFVLLRIADTGCGMDPHTMKRMYDPFFTTKEVGKGTGMGLATVYGIVVQHRGIVHAESEPGKGTTFQVYLPVDEPVSGAPVPTEPSTDVRGGNETILIAEDEEPVRKLTARLLQRAGYRVLAAADGKEALSMIKTHAGDIHLVLLDVVMPVLGGRAVYDVVRREYPGMKVLFASGYSPSTVHTNFILDEGLHLIKKPYLPDELLRKISEVLARTEPGE